MAVEEIYLSGSDAAAAGGLAALIAAFFIVFLLIFLIVYVVMALSLMIIARKTKTPNGWLAWIPFANVFLMTNIAKMHWLWALGIILLPFVPIIGGLVSLALSIAVVWKIAERRGKPGPLSLLMLFPVLGALILFLYLAFSD